MPRALKDQSCLICDQSPCVCNKSTKTSPGRSESKPVSAPKSSEQGADTLRSRSGGKTLSELRSAMKAAASEGVSGVTFPTPPPPPSNKIAPTSSVEDLELAAAIRVLGPILHESERARYAGILNSPPTMGERKAGWKNRRRG